MIHRPEPDHPSMPDAGTLPGALRSRWAAALLWLPALAWVAWMERLILRRGAPLDPGWLDAARALGVRHPERVRVHRVRQLPVRLPATLRRALVAAGWLPPALAGMALRYGILLREDCRGDGGLLLHELAHTAQYERLGGIGPFLRRYLAECCGPGYHESALEQEATALARRHLAAAQGVAPMSDALPVTSNRRGH